MEQLLRREDVATKLQCSPAHISNLTKRGVIRAIRLGKSVRYHPDDIETLIEENRRLR